MIRVARVLFYAGVPVALIGGGFLPSRCHGGGAMLAWALRL
jgi:hypothetical protein